LMSPEHFAICQRLKLDAIIGNELELCERMFF